MIKRTRGEVAFDICAYIVLALVAFTAIYPFIHALSISFSDRGEALRSGWHFYPRRISLDAYRKVFSSPLIWVGYSNTIFRTVVGTALSLLFTAFAAYPLSKRYFPGRNAFLYIILFTMLFDGGMVPTYLLIKDLKLLNSRWVYILPGVANAFNTIVMLNFFRSIPDSLEESACIDGASELRVLFSIVLPLSIPVMATIGLWVAVGHWNAFMDNLLYVTDRNKVVLQEVLREILIEERQDSFVAMLKNMEAPPPAESVKMASIVVSIVPVLIAYPFLQKYFVKGIMIGSIKG